MLNAYLYAGLRTPFGKNAGGLAPVRPDDLLAYTFKALIEQTGVDTKTLDDVIVGCANQAGEDSRCVARHAVLLAGLPVELGGTVVQRNCGSGLGALISAAHAITVGEGEMMLSGGVESMSRSAFVMAKADKPYSRDMRVFDSAVGARFPNPKIEKEFGADSMPQTADNLAQQYELSREAVDAFAKASQDKYQAALEAGFFKDEIVPVTIQAKGAKEPTVVARDEFPRATTMEALGKLQAIHQGGVTTAGNASGLNDGAVALLVGSQAAGERAGLKPMARIVSSAVVGVEPRIMGIGPVPAIQKALERAGLTLEQMDVIEINEAFAAQALACTRALKLRDDDPRVNPNGGAVALGHPLGASGARLALTAARQLERTQGRYAVVSMCIGVGQGIAVVLENCASR